MAGRRGSGCAGVAADGKDARCALAECPLAGRSDPRCSRCTGPVSWTGEDGRRTGVGGAAHRACTNCPMDGLGLPVCWAACDGPNQDFSTDGKKMVTLGGMDDADAFVGSRMEVVGGCDGGCGGGFGRMELMLAESVIGMDARTWERFSASCARRDAVAAARDAGAPMAAFRGPGGEWEGSAAQRIMDAIGWMSASQHEVLCAMARGMSMGETGRRANVTKQAVSRMLGRIVERSGLDSSAITLVGEGWRGRRRG